MHQGASSGALGLYGIATDVYQPLSTRDLAKPSVIVDSLAEEWEIVSVDAEELRTLPHDSPQALSIQQFFTLVNRAHYAQINIPGAFEQIAKNFFMQIMEQPALRRAGALITEVVELHLLTAQITRSNLDIICSAITSMKEPPTFLSSISFFGHRQPYLLDERDDEICEMDVDSSIDQLIRI